MTELLLNYANDNAGDAGRQVEVMDTTELDVGFAATQSATGIAQGTQESGVKEPFGIQIMEDDTTGFVKTWEATAGPNTAESSPTFCGGTVKTQDDGGTGPGGDERSQGIA